MCKHVFTHTITFPKREMKKYWVPLVFFQLYFFFVFLCFFTRVDGKTKEKQRENKENVKLKKIPVEPNIFSLHVCEMFVCV